LTIVWDLLYLTGLVVGAPFLAYRMFATEKYRRGLSEKLGFVPRREGPGPRIWIHGVSVGEIIAARSLIKAIQTQIPQADLLITVTTNTGHAVARRNHPDLPVYYWPLDFSFITRRVLDRFAPDVVVLMELELWPNFLTEARRMGIPVALANGRISAKSYYVYKRSWPFLKRSLVGINLFAVQTDLYAKRLLDLGIPPAKVHITGNMKYDAVAATVPSDPAAERAELGIGPEELVFTAGSTHPGEEAGVVDAYRAARQATAEPVRLILVPRAPERVGEVRDLVESKGLSTVFKSAITGYVPREAVIIGDTMGEMMKIYAASDIVFVGGSLIPHGGQNMLEPAACGKAVLFGPHTENFREAVELLIGTEAAVRVADAEALSREVRRLAADAATRQRLGAAASAAVKTRLGATQRHLELIQGLLQERDARLGAQRKRPSPAKL